MFVYFLYTFSSLIDKLVSINESAAPITAEYDVYKVKSSFY